MNYPKISSWYILFIVCLFCNGSLLSMDTLPLKNYFYSYRLVEIDTRSLVNQIENSHQSENISLRLLNWDLSLKHSSILSETYSCMVAGDFEMFIASHSPAIPLNGYTSVGGRVSITIGSQFIQGFIRSGEDIFYIEPVYHFKKDHPPGWFVVYRVDDIIPGKEHTCGVNESHKLHWDDRHTEKNTYRSGDCFRVEYAIATDFLMYDHYGSVAAVENHNVAVTNDMQTNYDDEFADEIQFVIVQQFIVTSPGSDPFTTSADAGDLLDSFTAWGPSGFTVSHDVGTLWTKRDLDGSTIGLAWIGTVCTTHRYHICEDFSTDANHKRVLLAHEIGHNFDAIHDASGNYIMLPSVGNYTAWSAQSIADIQAYYSSLTCLDDCVGTTPTISFLSSGGMTTENGDIQGSLYCGSPYKTVTIPVRQSFLTSVPGIVSVSVHVSTTATEGTDFVLMTSSLTFPANSATTQYIELRIIDDAIEEFDENIVLEISIISGAAILGTYPLYTLTIKDGLDLVNTSCCTPGGYTTYGSGTIGTPFIFTGAYQDGRSRFLYLASHLTAAGITSGYLTGIAFNTLSKYSSFPYQNFRVAMSNVPMTTLENQPWVPTEEVFLGTVTTVLNAWVTIDFSVPFYWDGSSSLYIEFCYDNTVSSNYDYILATDPVGGGTGKYCDALVNNNASGCSLGEGDIVLNYTNQSRQPHFRFYKMGGAKIETATGNSSVSGLKSGDIAHFYSSNHKVIASVKNIGQTDLGCVEVEVASSGTGKLALPFGGGDYAAKTIQVNADENSLYEITLYYTQAEMNTWGTNAGKLNLIKSSSPLAGAVFSGVEIIRPDSVYASFGPDNAYVYRGTFTGFSWFSLTNRSISSGTDLAGNLVFVEPSKGVLIKNKSDVQYALTVNNSGVLQATNDPVGIHSFSFDNSDLHFSHNSYGLILRSTNSNYWKISVNNSGNILSASVPPPSSARVENVSDHILIEKPGGSIILHSPNNACWRVFVNETGGLRTVSIQCP